MSESSWSPLRDRLAPWSIVFAIPAAVLAVAVLGRWI